MNPHLRSAARSVVLAANTPVARRRALRALASAPRPLRLELGGLQTRPGWVVTNVNATAPLYLDATQRWPLEDASVELAYADNVIEHVSLAAGRAMLREAFRCLRPGGHLRLVTPDLRKHVDAYLQGDAAVSGELAAAYREIGLDVSHPVDLVRIPVESFGHHTGYVYDAAALTAELEAVGFTSVTLHAVGESDVDGLRGLDQRTDEGPAQMALQAVRP